MTKHGQAERDEGHDQRFAEELDDELAPVGPGRLADAHLRGPAADLAVARLMKFMQARTRIRKAIAEKT